MSYQLYVTGGYGFTENLLPSLLHATEAVSITQEYFSRGYQGAHIDPAPDGDFPAPDRASPRDRQAILDSLHTGHLVLARRDSPSYGLFRDRTTSPEHLREDLPAALQNKLRKRWPSGLTGGGAGNLRTDSLHAPANDVQYTGSQPVPQPLPGTGPYKLSIRYHWPDGSGVAGLAFQIGTDLESLEGKLDALGTATAKGLNGRFATVRLGSDANDDTVRHERKAIIEGLERLLEQERRETQARETVYDDLAWHQKPVVSLGAVFQGAFDAGVGLFDFATGLAELADPTQRMTDALVSAWAANRDNSNDSWYEVFNKHHDEIRHARWVRAIGFDPADFSREAVAEAYELASLVMADDLLRAALKDFTQNYAAIQHHTEYTYVAGAVAFELVLAAVLAATTLGAGNAAQASSRIRHAKPLAALGPSFRRFGAALKLQGLRRVWRDADLSKNHHFEAEARPRPEGIEAKPTTSNSAGRPKKTSPRSFDEAKTILNDARAAIIANGKAPPPKYTQAQLHQIAAEGLGDEKYIARLVEEPHINRNGPNSGTLGKGGPAGVQVWSTSFDQIAHLDTDPKLIAEALGVNYKPDAKYKLAIVDQAGAVKHADAKTIVPTYDNLKTFTRDNLDGYEARPELLDQVMTPEYSKQYEALTRDMPDDAWKELKVRERYLSGKGLDRDERKLFETRFDIQDATGANEHFTGNGLTKTTSSSSADPVFGAVEAFSLHKNPKTFRQMTGMEGSTQWVELVDLKPIELGSN